MKKSLKILLLILISTSTAWCQNGDGLRRIHAAKMAYITDRLHITYKQSADFIPLYNEYEMEIRNTRQVFFKKYKGTNPDQGDDATSKQFIDDNLDYQQQVIEIKRKYNDLFLKIISPQQLADLYRAEREFKQMLMQRLRQQHGGGGRFNNRGNGY
jgi:hypothetical protein